MLFVQGVLWEMQMILRVPLRFWRKLLRKGEGRGSGDINVLYPNY
jgi:hypothetical protein